MIDAKYFEERIQSAEKLDLDNWLCAWLLPRILNSSVKRASTFTTKHLRESICYYQNIINDKNNTPHISW